MAENDRDTAELLAHSLKGLSGNIGAFGLHQLAGGLEIAIRQAQPVAEVEKRVRALKGVLGNVITQMELKLPPERNGIPGGVERDVRVECRFVESWISKSL